MSWSAAVGGRTSGLRRGNVEASEGSQFSGGRRAGGRPNVKSQGDVGRKGKGILLHQTGFILPDAVWMRSECGSEEGRWRVSPSLLQRTLQRFAGSRTVGIAPPSAPTTRPAQLSKQGFNRLVNPAGLPWIVKGGRLIGGAPFGYCPAESSGGRITWNARSPVEARPGSRSDRAVSRLA